MPQTIKEAFNDWVDLDQALHLVAYNIGLLPEGDSFPKGVYWSSNPVSDMLSKVLRGLEEAGMIEQRDGKTDTEFRWNPEYRPHWLTDDEKR